MKPPRDDERTGRFGLNRRQLLRTGAAVGAASLLPTTAGRTSAATPSLAKYVTDLPNPLDSLAVPDGKRQGADYYEVPARATTHEFHPDFGETRVWGFAERYPGPTFEIQQNRQIAVKWLNELPTEHFLPLDETLQGTRDNPEVRLVTHLHGGDTPAHSDGDPAAWFTQGFEETGPAFEREVYEYPNRQPGTALWYHDHAMSATYLSIYAGLAGFYILRDEREKSLDLPAYPYEVPLMLQDKEFDEDGELFYPRGAPADEPPKIPPHHDGDVAVVNGKVWPRLQVEPRKYRFRLLDAANHREFVLRLVEAGPDESLPPEGERVAGPPFVQIGTDGGLLPAPVVVDDGLLVTPGERHDVVVDFSEHAGESLILANRTPEGPGQPAPDLPEVMLFEVLGDVSEPDTSEVPTTLKTVPRIPESAATRTRNVTLNIVPSFGPDGFELLFKLNDKVYAEPVTEFVQQGHTEVWQFINGGPGPHPMHVHLVMFQILDRRPFDQERLEQEGVLDMGDPVPPAPNERGWKDTVVAESGMVTRVVAKFDRPGRYAYHCHLLEHAANNMMRPFVVERGTSGNDGTNGN